MRFLLVFLVVLVIAWRWRAWREAAQLEKKNSNTGSSVSTEMVQCRQCGLHLPANEAVAGKLGRYCSHAHRLTMEP